MRSFRCLQPRSWLWLAALALLLSACATGPRVRTDTDPAADFSRYRTWAFYTPLAMEQSGYTTYLTTHIRDAVRREMDARGYVYNESNPDLRVNFQGIVQEKTDVYATPRTDIQYYYSYRRRAYVGFPVWYDETRVNRYTEGTLSVDLVDARHNHLVWTGDAIGRVSRKQPEERAADAQRAVQEIFANYPYRAGSNAPVAPAR